MKSNFLFLLQISVLSSALASFSDFGIPKSNATVDVRAFDVGTATLTNETHTFFRPILPGHESLVIPLFAFLVEHKQSGKRVMFDLGMRSDPQNFAPSIKQFFTGGVMRIYESRDITGLLETGGISPSSIEAVVWSHAHFDHIGDMSKFPRGTRLVIGSETITETYPTFANATLLPSDFAGRNVTKINFKAAKLIFAGMNAVDYFGDGSFYLLDAPGYMRGHLIALARVTPSSFVVLGGDAFHHPGELRPRPALYDKYPCPAHLLTQTKTAISTDYFWSPDSSAGSFDLASRGQPFLTISDTSDSFYADPTLSQVSLDKIADFDADPDFFIVIAHDLSMRDFLPLFPASINTWKQDKLKDRALWRFLDSSSPAFLLGSLRS
ncbi:unnamed protein product [Mycena citricolor]|uniref:Metallo-beta-lactamase domain-containing protein n=1 Tax=Mycena citricolor TaxID=2018698 RepID=A0AAD2GX07_9AGAR|nr:unnamed protein product [Mycena citricolor]